MKPQKHTIKIIGGEHRSRILDVVDVEGLRPTSSRMRETLFNWLQLPVQNATVLDLFAGSGALGIEALSRGAKHATFIENNPQAYRTLSHNISTIIKDRSRFSVRKENAISFLKSLDTAIDIIFIDPPFHSNLLEETIDILHSASYIENTKYISIEKMKGLSTQINIEGFRLKRHTETKESSLLLFESKIIEAF